MSKKLLIAFAFLKIGLCAVAQNTPQSNNQDNAVISSPWHSTVVLGTSPRQSNPLVIINAGARTAQILPATESKHSFSTLLSDIHGSWMQSITVLKDQDAVDKYGNMGRYGAIEIELKDGALDKMPAHISERFK
jgi:hypothetical protein